jgi:hypothetical protein
VRRELVWGLLICVGCTGDVGDALPEGAELLDAAPGDALAIDGVEMIAPFEGEGVWAEIVFDDGATHTLEIETLPDGRVILLLPIEAEGEAVEASAEAASPGPCADGAKNLHNRRWTKTYQWSFNAASTPGYMNTDAVETRMKRAATNITRSDNNCGLLDHVSAQHSYEGRTTHGVQITSAAGCTGGNGHNTVAFGDLPSGVLGVACSWFSNGQMLESDVRLNKADFKWVAEIGSGCSNRWSVEAVMTHEMGHVFGLAHVGEANHGNLTMSTAINGPCQNSEASLGLGDVRGLRAKY